MNYDYQTLHRLNEIGTALTKERHIPALLEKILKSAKELTRADGGTIYTVTTEQTLRFEIALSDSLDFHVGGTSGRPVPFPDVPLIIDGKLNDQMMVAYAVNHKQTINIKDAYHESGFEFSGTKRFDETTGYRTRSVLTIPMKNHEQDVIAVLQLLNPMENGVVRPFTQEDLDLAESLTSQAGIALTNQLLISSLRSLFESLIRVIAEAVDAKSPSTGNHGKRVPIIALLLANAVNKSNEGVFRDIHFSKEELYELEVAAFLHDCGKITTPVHVVEKQNKLETLFDRMDSIKPRFQALFEKTEKEMLVKQIEWIKTHFPQEFATGKDEFAQMEAETDLKLANYDQDLEFLKRCNEGVEPITDEAKERLERIAATCYSSDFPLLTQDELKNLEIRKGNLTQEEREIIEHHVVMTYKMLSQLKYPKELQRVPEIASSHHERMDGRGYPRGLRREELSLQARILSIADIFEALSAPDRPYRKALSLSQVFEIMERMVEEGHLDPDLFDLFIKNKVYSLYAKQYLSLEQLDIN